MSWHLKINKVAKFESDNNEVTCKILQSYRILQRLRMMGDKFVLSTILGNPGQIVGARESLNRQKNMAQEKSKERQEEPLGAMSYQTSSKRLPSFRLLIGARKLVFF